MPNPPTICLPTPVIADKATRPHIVSLLMNTLAAADRDLQELLEKNECLTKELAELNAAAFESDKDGQLCDEENSGDDEENSGDDEENSGDDEENIGDDDSDDGMVLDDCSRDSESVRWHRKGSKDKKKSKKIKKLDQECRSRSGGGRPRTCHVRVMTTEGRAFQAKLEEKMLRRTSEIVIVPDECKIILKHTSLS